MREKQPRLLVIWGEYDLSFELSEPEAYRRDVPNAQVHVLDAGHFALDTAADEIAELSEASSVLLAERSLLGTLADPLPSQMTTGNLRSPELCSKKANPPILNHAVGQPSAFTAERLMEELRRSREIPDGAIPPVCILEFDGDLTDWLIRERLANPFPSWACFHTSMFALSVEGVECGIIARTIAGPYAVLIAEQLHAAGAKIIIGLTSAGRLAKDLSLPCLVVATSAVRDEGTSYHYLAPSEEVTCPTPLSAHLQRELEATGWNVRSGKVWTTDAPYRETREQIDKWAAENALAVEMQTASLFALAIARQASVACVAMVSNAVDHQGNQFDTGSPDDGFRTLQGITRAARSYLETL